MLHVLWMILKIILWILLGILGFALILIVLVLCSPIRYRAAVSYQGGKSVHADVKVRFLCVSFRLCFDQMTQKLEQTIRIFGIRFGRKKSKVSEETEMDDIRENGQEEIRENTHESPREIVEEETEEVVEKTEEVEEAESAEETEAVEKVEHVEETDDIVERLQPFDCFEEDEKEEASSKKKKTKKRDSIRIVILRIWDKLKAIYDFLESHTPDKVMEKLEEKTNVMQKKLRRLQKFWNLKCTVKTRAYLKRYIPGVFKHLLPRKISGRIHYGFGDPCKTGQITGYMSLVPIVYQKNLSLEPDFYQKVLELDIKLRGAFTIGYLARIVLNVNIWRTLKAAKRVMKG
ncbi:MAG: DUF2953 domain-containing protein [Wujia sp.]